MYRLPIRSAHWLCYNCSMNTEDIVHLASLARLDLTPEEIETFPSQIEAILSFVGQIKDAELPEGVIRDMQNYNTLREDFALEIDPSRDGIIAAFPAREGDLLEVSKILPN